MTTTSAKHLAQLRLGVQRLVCSDARTPADAVRGMLAMQGQDFTAVQWAIGARTPGATVTDIRSAFDSGAIVRTWPMRWTLHVMAAEDLRWMLPLTTPRVVRGAAGRFRRLELDDATFANARSIAEEVFAGGVALTRAEFFAHLEAAGIDTAGQRGVHIIGWLAQAGTVCWGPLSGKQQQLVLVDDWIPRAATDTLDGDDAAQLLLMRYLDGHGPATLDDFAWWCKLTKTDAKRALAACEADLERFEFEGATYWLTPAALERGTQALSAAAKSVLALPGFDEHLLGYQDRSLALDPDHMDLIVPGGNGMFRATIVDAGRVVGTWKRTTSRNGVGADPDPFTPLSKRATQEFARRANDVRAFWNAS